MRSYPHISARAPHQRAIATLCHRSRIDDQAPDARPYRIRYHPTVTINLDLIEKDARNVALARAIGECIMDAEQEQSAWHLGISGKQRGREPAVMT